MDYQDSGDCYSPSFPCVWPFEGLEPFGYPDAATEGLPTGAMNPWAEPHQYYWDVPRPPNIQPPKNPHWQMAGPPFNETNEVGPTGDTGVDIGRNAVEANKTPTKSARKRSERLARRRDINLQKSILLDEIGEIMEMECRTPELAVLNAAIVKMGGDVPSGVSGEGIKLAFRRLHELTGSQGKLRHVRCLERVIKALKGEPTLDPIFEGQPSGSA